MKYLLIGIGAPIAKVEGDNLSPDAAWWWWWWLCWWWWLWCPEPWLVETEDDVDKVADTWQLEAYKQCIIELSTIHPLKLLIPEMLFKITLILIYQPT